MVTFVILPFISTSYPMVNDNKASIVPYNITILNTYYVYN